MRLLVQTRRGAIRNLRTFVYAGRTCTIRFPWPPPPRSATRSRQPLVLFGRQQDFSGRHGNAGEAQWTRRVFLPDGVVGRAEDTLKESRVDRWKRDTYANARKTLMYGTFINFGLAIHLRTFTFPKHTNFEKQPGKI